MDNLETSETDEPCEPRNHNDNSIGWGNVAILGASTLLVAALVRRAERCERAFVRQRDAYVDLAADAGLLVRNAPRSKPILGSLNAEHAMRLFREAADAVPRRTELDGHDYRNRGPAPLVYREVGATGDPYPPWVQELRGKSGVYVIRDRVTHEALYVGESHAAKLYQTLTRHLQRWTRWKSWWRGQYTEESNHDPGLTYDRASVEVAARVLSPDEAIDEEERLIARLNPRDNVNRVPF